MMQSLRSRLYEIIFEHDTWGGKAFDVVLMWCILSSVFAVVLESVHAIRHGHGAILRAVEWFFTILFTIEYVLRLAAVPKPWRYATSLFGLVDLLAVIPTYLSLFLPGAQSLLVIRALRLLRVFRVLKLGHHVSEAHVLAEALKASRHKITVFLSAVLTMALIIGALMYLIEGENNGFTSIPISVYWAVVTLTTVGYGDLAPQTVLGKLLASILMIIGYGVIAVPTGIVTSELTQLTHRGTSRLCSGCGAKGHDRDARHCKYCATALGSG